MHANPDIEFDYYIAERLGMTVQELLTGVKGPISNLEWMEWQIYFGRKAQRRQIANAKQNDAMKRKK